MKTRRILMVLALSAALFGRAEAAPATLTLACEDRENYPAVMGEGGDIAPRNPGLSIELLNLVGKDLGIRISFIRLPWNRCKNELRYGKVDGIFDTGYAPEERMIGVFPMKAGAPDPERRMNMVSFAVYVVKGSGVSWDGGYFSPKTLRIGVPMGYSVAGDIRRLGIAVEESPGIETGFRKLAYGRINAFVAPESAGDHLKKARSKDFPSIIRLDKPFTTQPFYLMFSHQFYSRNRALAEAIWEAVAVLRESEPMRAAAARYGKL